MVPKIGFERVTISIDMRESEPFKLTPANTAAPLIVPENATWVYKTRKKY